MTKPDDTFTQELSLPEPIRQRFDALHDRVLTILREADINANFLMTRFEYDLEAFLIIQALDQAHSHADVERIIDDAFSQRFGGVMDAGEQERLRAQYAADHIWQAWVTYREKNDRTLNTRAGTLLAYRKDRQDNPEGIRGW
jgi:hypothetical protein